MECSTIQYSIGETVKEAFSSIDNVSRFEVILVILWRDLGEFSGVFGIGVR